MTQISFSSDSLPLIEKGVELTKEIDNLDKLNHIDNGRFKGLVDEVGMKEICFKCAYMDTRLPAGMGYKCFCVGSCFPATFHPHVVSYIAWKLGWKTSEEHVRVINGD